MKQRIKEIKEWIHEHKKELIIAGVSISFVIGVIVAIKNQDKLEEAFASLKNLIEKPQAHGSFPQTKNIIVDEVSKNSDPIVLEPIDILEKTKRAPHEVRLHFRKLPTGCKASPQKKAQALEAGWDLGTDLTFVNSYCTGANVA